MVLNHSDKLQELGSGKIRIFNYSGILSEILPLIQPTRSRGLPAHVTNGNKTILHNPAVIDLLENLILTRVFTNQKPSPFSI